MEYEVEEKLTKEVALQKIEEIKREAIQDNEIASFLEDVLELWFIQSCAQGLYNNLDEVKEVAAIVESSGDIEFIRC